ncbi:MAG: twin-arginine translocation pathway signal [Sphingomonadales bacterium 32-64-17]|nr:MAG: twin-arginine translocation pathway signal [Sphingomonadales bacterium 32-64-17]
MHSFDTPMLTRRAALKGASGLAIAATLPGCVTATTSATADTGAKALLDDVAWRLLSHQPGRATSLGVDTGVHAAMRGRLEDSSLEGRAALAETLREDLARVSSVNESGLDAPTRTSLEVVKSAYANALEGFALPYGDVAVGSWRNAPYVVIQNVGGYLDLPRSFDSDQPLRDGADVDYYMERLAQVPASLAGELERMQSAREMGLVAPDFLLDKAIGQMEQTITDSAEGGGWAMPLGRSDLPEAKAALPHAVQLAQSVIAPVLAAQLEELKAERALATSDAGMWARPGGPDYYRWALKASTTTNITPEEVHELGHDTLASIHAKMEPILRSLGYTEGTAGQRMKQLSEDERFKFAEGDEGRAQIMDFIHERIDWIRSQMPRAFSRTVPANLEVRRLPLAEEPGAPTAYGGAGSKDGSIPGKMWINLLTTDLHRKYTLPTLVHHETIPGHVWEGEYSNQLPLIRSILAFNSFSEGWALYAEQLADELGAYADHPAWQLGYLQDAAFRACRLVVDSGMHAKRWSRAEALAFITEQTGDGADEMASEIDRYCSWPGQACGYMVGKLEILRQRESALEALGARYDLKDFNMAVVEGGNVPLDVLAGNISRYIAGATG